MPLLSKSLAQDWVLVLDVLQKLTSLTISHSPSISLTICLSKEAKKGEKSALNVDIRAILVTKFETEIQHLLYFTSIICHVRTIKCTRVMPFAFSQTSSTSTSLVLHMNL